MQKTYTRITHEARRATLIAMPAEERHADRFATTGARMIVVESEDDLPSVAAFDSWAAAGIAHRIRRSSLNPTRSPTSRSKDSRSSSRSWQAGPRRRSTLRPPGCSTCSRSSASTRVNHSQPGASRTKSGSPGAPRPELPCRHRRKRGELRPQHPARLGGSPARQQRRSARPRGVRGGLRRPEPLHTRVLPPLWRRTRAVPARAPLRQTPSSAFKTAPFAAMTLRVIQALGRRPTMRKALLFTLVALAATGVAWPATARPQAAAPIWSCTTSSGSRRSSCRRSRSTPARTAATSSIARSTMAHRSLRAGGHLPDGDRQGRVDRRRDQGVERSDVRRSRGVVARHGQRRGVEGTRRHHNVHGCRHAGRDDRLLRHASGVQASVRDRSREHPGSRLIRR